MSILCPQPSPLVAPSLRRFVASNLIPFLILILLALLLRLPGLDNRVMHTDEAINTEITRQLWQEGTYQYNPREHHGPTLHYLTLPILWLGADNYAGSQPWHYRVVAVVCALGLILLLPLVADGLGRPAVFVAGVLVALSPAMVFYSRYYIHEMPLLLATFFTIAAGWRHLQTGRLVWALAAGAGLGLMAATKETWIIPAACMAVALAAVWLLRGRGAFGAARLRSLGWVIATAVVIAAMLFTSFLTHPRGLIDALAAFATYLDRGVSSGEHDHPPLYYLSLLAWHRIGQGPLWTELAIVLPAAVGAAWALWPGQVKDAPLPAFLAIYTLLLTLIFSLIAYKTPWNALLFLHGMTLLAGVGGAVMLRPGHWALRTGALVLLVAAAGHLGWQAHRTVARFENDRRNPWVYAHPLRDVLRLQQRLLDLAAVAPEGMAMRITVVSADPWPMPWYLRQFEQVGYWTALADIRTRPNLLLIDADLVDDLPEAWADQYQAEVYGLRPATHLLLFIDRDLWDRFMATRQ